jgi:hypothetical protein
MNDLIPTGQISGFTSKTASVGGVRLHYLIGGNPIGPLSFSGTASSAPVASGAR